MEKEIVFKIIYQSILIFSFFMNPLLAQPEEEWKLNIGGSNGEFATSLLQTFDGGYMLLANSRSADGDFSTNYGNYDCVLVKINAQAEVVWEKNYGGTSSDFGNSIFQNSDGSYTIAGYTESDDGDIDGNNGDRDFWIFKVSESGSLEWSRNYGGQREDIADSIQPSSDGGYIVSGISNSNSGDVSSPNGLQDGWVIKLDPDGNLEWENSYGGTNGDNLRFAIQINDGGYVLAGSAASMNGDVEQNIGSGDFWILKVNQIGNLEWAKNHGGTNSDFIRYILETEDGGYITAGTTYSDDGDVSQYHGEGDFWVVKTDESGNLEWEKNYGGEDTEVVRTLEKTSDGGYVVTGFSRSDNFDVGANFGDFDFWIIKIDNSGNLEWSKNFGGSGEDRCDPIIQTTDGGYLLAGSSVSNDGDFDVNHGFADIWLIKLANLNPNQNSDLHFDSHFKINPNPSKGAFEIQPKDFLDSFDVKIFDSNGRLYYHNNKVVDKLFINNFPTGHYFVNIIAEGKHYVSKLIVH